MGTLVAGQDARRDGSCRSGGVRDQYREAAPCRSGETKHDRPKQKLVRPGPNSRP